jgi:hypothetical protein
MKVSLPSIEMEFAGDMFIVTFLRSPYLEDSPEYEDHQFHFDRNRWISKTYAVGERWKAGDLKPCYCNYRGMEALVHLLDLAVQMSNTPEELEAYREEIVEWTKPFIEVQTQLNILVGKYTDVKCLTDPLKAKVQAFSLQ